MGKTKHWDRYHDPDDGGDEMTEEYAEMIRRNEARKRKQEQAGETIESDWPLRKKF